MTRLLTLLTLSLLLMGLAATGALAQQYPPNPGPVTEVNVTVTTPGATVRIEGRSWGPDTTVEIDHGDTGGQSSTSATTVEVADDGTFVAEVAVPDDAAGDFEVVTRGVDADGTTQVRPLVLSVAGDEDDGASGAATSGSGGEPAATTANPASAFLAGGNSLLVLLVLGAAVVLVMVRRRSTAG